MIAGYSWLYPHWRPPALTQLTTEPPPPAVCKPRRPTAKRIRAQFEAIGLSGLLDVTRHDDGTYTATFDMPRLDWRLRERFGAALAKQRAGEIEYLFGYTIVRSGTDYRRARGQFAGMTTPMVTFKLDPLPTPNKGKCLTAPPLVLTLPQVIYPTPSAAA